MIFVGHTTWVGFLSAGKLDETCRRQEQDIMHLKRALKEREEGPRIDIWFGGWSTYGTDDTRKQKFQSVKCWSTMICSMFISGEEKKYIGPLSSWLVGGKVWALTTRLFMKRWDKFSVVPHKRETKKKASEGIPISSDLESAHLTAGFWCLNNFNLFKPFRSMWSYVKWFILVGSGSIFSGWVGWWIKSPRELPNA